MFAPTDTAQQEDICRNIAQVGEIYWKLVLLLVVMLVVVLFLLLLLKLLILFLLVVVEVVSLYLQLPWTKSVDSGVLISPSSGQPPVRILFSRM